MKLDKKSLNLYAVTDSKWLNGDKLANKVEEAILGGATFIQLREKNADINKYIEVAKEVKKVTDKYKVPFVIDDNIEVCVKSGADGIHIGQKDIKADVARKLLGKDKILGVSVQKIGRASCRERV